MSERRDECVVQQVMNTSGFSLSFHLNVNWVNDMCVRRAHVNTHERTNITFRAINSWTVWMRTCLPSFSKYERMRCSSTCTRTSIELYCSDMYQTCTHHHHSINLCSHESEASNGIRDILSPVWFNKSYLVGNYSSGICVDSIDERAHERKANENSAVD